MFAVKSDKYFHDICTIGIKYYIYNYKEQYGVTHL